MRAWSSSTSTSSIVKARAKEAREASRSPPPIEGEGITGGEGINFLYSGVHYLEYKTTL